MSKQPYVVVLCIHFTPYYINKYCEGWCDVTDVDCAGNQFAPKKEKYNEGCSVYMNLDESKEDVI